MYETFYYLWVKRFLNIRRERHNLSMLTFPSPPPTSTTTTRDTRRKASASSESQPSSSDAKTPPLTFFSNPQNPPRTLAVHDVILIPRSYFLSGVSIVTSLNDTSASRACEHLRSCLHLTNPCTKRKVLSLTKPKGKIYKTKYYIASIEHFFGHVIYPLQNIAKL